MSGAVPVIPKFQFVSSTGAPLANGTVTVYVAGTTTLTDTWQNSALSVLNENPITLDANGRCDIWLDPDVTYKFLLKNAGGATQWTVDNIPGAQAASFAGTLAGATGSSLVGFLAPGASAILSTVENRLNEWISVLDFIPEAQRDGIVAGTSTYDCTDAFEDWTAAFGVQAHGVIPPGVYYVDTAVFDSLDKVTVYCYGKIRRKDSSTSAGVRIVDCTHSNFYFENVSSGVEDTPASYAALTGAGIQVADSNGCLVEAGTITGFAKCWDIVSETTAGVYFCRIKHNHTRFNNDGLCLRVADGVVGFVNGNSFWGEEIRCEASGVKFIKGSSQTDPFNGNTFYSVNIEQADDAYDLDFAVGNTIINPRLEGGNRPTVGGLAIAGRWFKSTATCARNTYIGSTFPLDKMEILEPGAQIIGGIFDNGVGVNYGQMAFTDYGPSQKLHILGFRDTPTPTTSSNGMNIRNYLFNVDPGVTSADKGITALKIVDASGTKRVSYRQDGQIDATNVNADLPYGITVSRVQTNTAAVKLFMKASDFYAGRILYLDVTNFTNSITIRNEADTSDYLAAGQITGVGMWMVYVDSGLGMRAKQLS